MFANLANKGVSATSTMTIVGASASKSKSSRNFLKFIEAVGAGGTITNHYPVQHQQHRLISSGTINIVSHRPAQNQPSRLPLPLCNSCLFQNVRSYAKGKDKPGHKKAVTVNENEMAELIDVEEFKETQNSLLDDMKDEFAKQLTIHGASGALETLEVEFDGETYPLQELAQIGRKNPQLVVLNLASLPDACQAVIKAIQESGMNLNPQQEGTTIYVPLPKVTREHREFLAKNAKVIFVKYKTNLQSVQNRYIKEVRSKKEMSQDLVFSVTQQIMKLTSQYIADAEHLVTLKQKELLETK